MGRVIMDRMLLRLVLLGVLVLSGAACVPSESDTDASTTVDDTSAPTVAPTTPTTDVGDTLTGLGATKAGFLRVHLANRSTDYDADPTVGTTANSHYRYTSINFVSNTHLRELERRVPRGTNLAQAQQTIMEDVPGDAVVVWRSGEVPSRPTGSCAQMGVKSATLGQIFDDSGFVLVTFYTGGDDGLSDQDFSSSNVTNIVAKIFQETGSLAECW